MEDTFVDAAVTEPLLHVSVERNTASGQGRKGQRRQVRREVEAEVGKEVREQVLIPPGCQFCQTKHFGRPVVDTPREEDNRSNPLGLASGLTVCTREYLSVTASSLVGARAHFERQKVLPRR